MSLVAEMPAPSKQKPVQAVLCVDDDAIDRFGRVLRHLVVGLVDQAVSLRLVGNDHRVDSLALGPVQTLTHRPMTWPMAGRRRARLIESLAASPPTVVHAMSGGSYALALHVADAFDADVALQVSSLLDCESLGQIPLSRVGRFLACTEPLVDVLHRQVGAVPSEVVLVRPGVQVHAEPGGHADPAHVITIVSTSPFEIWSGLHHLIGALQRVKEAGFSFLAFLLGEGSKEGYLYRLVREKGLSAHVVFAKPLGDPTHAMSSADVFVRPSIDTAFVADSLLAMGAGITVVAATSPVCDHLHDGRTAIMVREPTPDALADGIQLVLRDPVGARAISESARDHVRGHHAMSKMAELTATAYREMALSRATFSISPS